MIFWKFRLSQWYRNEFCPKWDKFIHFRKCSCGHPFWMHQCYQHGTCIHGVCLAETFSFEDPDVVCCCQGFNDMWNNEYPPNKPELRNTLSNKDGEKK